MVGFHNHRFAFDAGDLGEHENLMPCVIFGCGNRVRVSNNAHALDAHIVCIKPGVPHRVTVRHGGAQIIYLDGVHMSEHRDDFSDLDLTWRDFPGAFMDKDLGAVSKLRTTLQGSRPPPDPAVMRVVDVIYTKPFERMTQVALSQTLGLERTQALRHFKATTGQTFRKFKIWAGIIAATGIAHRGEQIGKAGVDAGFSDSSHLANAAMQTFGLTPTAGLTNLAGFQTLVGS